MARRDHCNPTVIVQIRHPYCGTRSPEIIVLGGMMGFGATVVWWVFFSRAPRFDRWGSAALMLVALGATSLSIHESLRLQPFVAHIIPGLSLAFVAAAVASRNLSQKSRRIVLTAAILLSCGAWTMLRTDGMRADASGDFAWRWAATPEEQFLTQVSNAATTSPNMPAGETLYKWTGFRGPGRDGIVRGVQIETDWDNSPPVELWRRLVGPGWSSFAVHNDLFYTQEQHGEEEVISGYSLTTGNPVWKHSDSTRFWESNGGAGPRGTPTLHNGHLYCLGGTGIVNALNAADGSPVWSRNAGTDTDTKLPTWGFSSSPLVIDDLVIVAAGGSLVAYDLTNGEPRWIKPAPAGDCYSSPHLVNIDSIAQVMLLNDSGAISVAPADGNLLWHYPWPGHPIVQPALIADGDMLISADERTGVRRIKITHGPAGWSVEAHWTSTRIKPYFNDSVVHKGHAYGFDGHSISCIDLTDGSRKWRGGRYGRGQFILLADQDLLLVLSEKGELALVEALPNQFTELVRYPAIKGKTWNHPVLVGDILLVRNAQEMVAFRLSLMSDSKEVL
ncbi:PQQ-like beta-propeller repeat protein [bacterium]|nr:PQQ-like beta-propeller repeat protein [bacterium]